MPYVVNAAFDIGNLQEARVLSDEVIEEGAGSWKLATTIQDLRDALIRLKTTQEGSIRKTALDARGAALDGCWTISFINLANFFQDRGLIS
jgi:hypothetical protein